MTNFSTNQVMQFYALDGLKTLSAEVKGDITKTSAKIIFTKNNGEKFSSDRIENVMWCTLVETDALTTPTTSATVEFAKNAVVAGEDYVVRVSYPEVGGAGIESWTTKTAVAHATKDSTAASVIADLKAQLEKIFAVDGILYVGASEGAGIAINPTVPTNYERGVRPIVVPEFRVSVNQVADSGVLVDWAKLTDDGQIPVIKNTAITVPSGYKVADMEYFAMGERADEYRMAGYPDVVKTDYVVDPTQNYNMLVIHYAHKGANSDSHKSEKDLIIASDDTAYLNEIISGLKNNIADFPYSVNVTGTPEGDTPKMTAAE